MEAVPVTDEERIWTHAGAYQKEYKVLWSPHQRCLKDSSLLLFAHSAEREAREGAFEVY